jgi:GT2 family glycosyltransferase
VASDQQQQPAVCVIVPCYNSERTIRPCLASIMAQRTAVNYEVIVVDSSTDDTPRIVEREFPSARLVHLDERTFAGAARNVGVRTTRAPFCLMIDSDCVARPDLIERMMARHAESRYAAVGGALRNGTPRSLSGWVGYMMEFKEFIPSAPERLVGSVPTANVTYRREALERYGCFDEDMWLAEDILFNHRLHSAGERILFDPTIEVTHLNRVGWRNVLGYQVSLGRFSAIARARGGLPGSFLLRYPALILLMPAVRLMRAFQWLASTDRKALLLLLAAWPLYMLASAFWSYGFFRQTLAQRAGDL